MIQILGYREINKGAVLGTVNIKIVKWGLNVNRITVFQKGNNRWISFPSESYESEGEKKYFPLVKFEDRETMDRFTRNVLESLDKYLSDLTRQEKPKEHQEELPF